MARVCIGHFLREAETLIVDGMFYASATSFQQTFTIFCDNGRGVFYPYLYCLLSAKTEVQFKKLFRVLKEKGIISVTKVVMDNEKAVISALRTHNDDEDINCVPFSPPSEFF